MRQWFVTFVSNPGYVPKGSGNLETLITNSSGLSGTNSTVIASELVEGSAPIGGSFRLRFAGHETGALSWNASSAEVRSAVEALPGAGTVEVNLMSRMDASLQTALPGTISLANESSVAATTEDLRPHISRGDTIIILDTAYLVADEGQFEFDELPLKLPWKGPSIFGVRAFRRSVAPGADHYFGSRWLAPLPGTARACAPSRRRGARRRRLRTAARRRRTAARSRSSSTAAPRRASPEGATGRRGCAGSRGGWSSSPLRA